MFTLQDIVQPATIKEAYEILMQEKNNTVLGGCAYLRLGSQNFNTAIDLTNLNLHYIQEQEEYFEIGAMATFRDIEKYAAFHESFSGMLPKAVNPIIGVQFRNIVTVGATVYAKYGFSNLITALLALETEVELYNGGRMALDVFLSKPIPKDILTKIFIKKENRKAAYQCLRNSASDYPILNVAVSNLQDKWRIIVGARPQGAKTAVKASTELSKGIINEDDIEYAAQLAAEELAFGTNMRGTAEYRRELCKVLVKRAVMEVCQCK